MTPVQSLPSPQFQLGQQFTLSRTVILSIAFARYVLVKLHRVRRKVQSIRVCRFLFASVVQIVHATHQSCTGFVVVKVCPILPSYAATFNRLQASHTRGKCDDLHVQHKYHRYLDCKQHTRSPRPWMAPANDPHPSSARHGFGEF